MQNKILRYKEVSISIEDNNLIRGFALIMLIIHHLFWNVPGYGIKIGEIYVWQYIAIIFKICVPIFLFLSGYGLGINYMKHLDVKSFYKKRLIKIYTFYWFVILISFIVGITLFKDQVALMLGNNFLNASIKLMMTFTGLQYVFGYMGFNPSWWFISELIVCYLVFPFVREGINKYNTYFLLFSLIFCNLIVLLPVSLLNLNKIVFYIFPFIFGVYVRKNNILTKIYYLLKESSLKIYFNFLTLVIMLALFYVQSIYKLNSYGLIATNFSAYVVIILLLVNKDIFKGINKYFQFIGVYFFDIYLIHMFVTNYYLANFIYSLKYPIIIVVASFVITLVLSILTHSLRNKVNKYVNKFAT
jgi:peptidoglycan/LPS O-acetylase OafA/YrhL